MTPGRLWWLFRRDLSRGWAATWSDYRVRPHIWGWRNTHAGAPVVPVSVHVLCGAEHIDLAAWMIASWSEQTGRNWRFVLHDDGSLTAGHAEKLALLGLDLTRIARADADVRMARLLANRPACAAYRYKHPLGRKIFDVPIYAEGQRFILLDTDVLFFSRPTEMLAWVGREGDDACWFNADCAEASNVSADEARARLGVDLWPRVNSGIGLLTPKAIDLDFCERVLRETSALAGHVWRVEQTLFALCASRHGRGGLLPPTYEVTLAPQMSRTTIARHYVGAVRDRFWAEGVRTLKSQLFAR